MRALPPDTTIQAEEGGAAAPFDILDTEAVRLYQEDALEGIQRIEDGSVDLIVADPPYGLGKDYGNDSDLLSGQAYLDWSERWMDAVGSSLGSLRRRSESP